MRLSIRGGKLSRNRKQFYRRGIYNDAKWETSDDWWQNVPFPMCADPNCAHSRKYPHWDSCPIGPLVILLPLHRTPGTTVNMDLAQNSTNTLVCVQIVLVQIFCNIAKVEIFKCEWRVFLETVTTYSRLIKSCKCISLLARK